MAWGLPKLPGLTFSDPTKTQHHIRSSLYFHQGHRIPDPVVLGPGRSPTDLDSNAFTLPEDTVIYDPSLTYGRVKQPALPPVVPLWAHYDKRCLNFQAFMKQPVYDNPLEKYRLRYVNIVYFLEDDSITVMEKPIRNSGIWQGRMVKRGKIPKNDLGELWHWKDLDVGKDICIYGKVFHTVSCDLFTKEWLESNGIELSKEEEMPSDAFTENERWKNVPPPTRSQLKTDPLRRFLEYDGKVLVFNCVWDNRDAEHGELGEYKMLYFLQDDTISVKELHDERGGKDPFPLLLKKTKLPKKWKDVPVNFPSSVLELSDEEVTEYYAPRDLMIGATIFVLGRRFLLYDCDKFTRLYYKSMLGIEQPPAIKLEKKEQKEFKKTLPPHIGIGAPEDTIQSCFGLVPKPPHKDVIKYNLNANKYLRYLCELDWIHPEDQGRQFILSYALFDGTIKIKEVPRRNSGIWEGKFLNAMRLQLPGSDPNFPTYYTPDKLYVGAIIPVFKFRFKIVGCDLFVHRYMSANPDKFPQEVIDNVRNYHMSEGNLKDELEEAIRDEATEHQRAQLGEMGKAPVAMVHPMQECLTELNVVEGQAANARPPTPPLNTDVISYDDSLGLVRMSKPPCQGVQPLKGILKSSAPRDDHQKVVCFSGPAADEHRQEKHEHYPPGQQPHFNDEKNFCGRYSAPDAGERQERREKDICAYEVTPQRTDASGMIEKPKGPGFLGSYGVDCAENPEFMRLPADAYETAKGLRREVAEISPAATRVAEHPRGPVPPAAACAQPPPGAGAGGGPCAPFRPEDVAFSCPHAPLRKPCCDAHEGEGKRDQ